MVHRRRVEAVRPLHGALSRILLIGGAGQLGWELNRTLAPLGQLIVTRRDGDPALDLADADAICRTVEAVRPRCIVNAAAYTAVDRAEQDPQAERINAVAPGVLAEQAKRCGAVLVHFSTDYVFSGKDDRPHEEDDPTAPCGVYGATKLAGERAVREVDGPHLVLRTSWVYGLRGRNFLLTLLRAAREREELRVVDDQRGSPNWSRLLAEATALLLARAEPTLASCRALYHLSGAGETSWYGFARAIFEECRELSTGIAPDPRIVPISTQEFGAPAPRPAYSTLSARRLVAEFGIRLPHWREALRLCLEDTSAWRCAR